MVIPAGNADVETELDGLAAMVWSSEAAGK